MRQVVDPRGRPVGLSTYQKNALYNRAKELKRDIKDSLLTKDELWRPTQTNIDKFRKREGHTGMTKKIEEYRKCMEAIGADPRDSRIESHRKSR